MTEEDLKKIQKRIAYNFKNIHLLQQAFIRESYVLQDREHQSSEPLKWIGDTVLSLIVKEKILAARAKINDLKEFEFCTSETDCEGILTTFLSESFLSQRVEIFGLNQYLVMGLDDKKRKAQKKYSAKSGLLKSIVGAIALDSNYNMFSLKASVELLLDLDFYLENGFFEGVNYLLLLQKWASVGQYPLPRYEFNSNSFSYGTNFFQCTCFVDQINRTFSAKGENRSHARMKAAKMAYEYLKEKNLLFTIRDEMKDPRPSRAVNQLQELALKGYFSVPVYEAVEQKDEEHEQIWICTCTIPEKEKSFSATALTKREAKRNAAYQMLLYVLE